MGYERHHTVVVTSWNDVLIQKAHDVAIETFVDTEAFVSEITPVATNGYRSFFVAPDGSKEGWDESDRGDEAREAFVGWLDNQRYGDGSSALRWCEVQFADDNGREFLKRSDHSTPGALGHPMSGPQ